MSKQPRKRTAATRSPGGEDAIPAPAGERVDLVSPDPRSLRGLAHPLRLQLLGLLRADGPATASQLAVRTGQSSGATSYHLRQLAAYGFVVEDANRGTGRDRWWRAAHRGTRFTLPEDADEESRALGEEYLRVVADANARQVQATIAGLATLDEDLGPGWSDAFTLSDLLLRLTLDEARALVAELRALGARYRSDDPESSTEAPADARRVVLQFQVLPSVSNDRAGID
jgi:DNA-binding transcriptional ArsR family regulator